MLIQDAQPGRCHTWAMRPAPPAAYGDDISCVDTLCASSRALLRSCILLSFLSCPKPRCCRPSRRRHPPRCCRSSCRRLRPGCLPSGDCLRVPVRNYVRTYVRTHFARGAGGKKAVIEGAGQRNARFSEGGWLENKTGWPGVRSGSATDGLEIGRSPLRGWQTPGRETGKRREGRSRPEQTGHH